MSFVRLFRKYSLLEIVSRTATFAFRITTSHWRTEPDFIIVGAQRGGTTSLYNYLISHPAVFPAFIKETHFFDLHYKRGIGWYRACFPWLVQKKHFYQTYQQKALSGEATPYYLFHPHVPVRVWQALPAVKLIVVLRNPVQRAFSHYHHEFKQGYEQRTFEQAVAWEMENMVSDPDRYVPAQGRPGFEHMHHSYVSRGLYLAQLQNWLQHFPREQLLVLSSEAFYHEPARILTETCQFLGLPGWVPGRFPKYNENKYVSMNVETQTLLASFYQAENQRLYQFLGQDLGW
ncbi:MAG: sulfotransferase domain-containing protein [Anaerolineales bacterium]|nr:sulfotransferase domain-containing protein [Anaerolineales bacterium]